MIANARPVPEARFTGDQMLDTGFHAILKPQELRSDLTVLFGSGANVLVLNDCEGVLMVDSGFGNSRPQITAGLSAISSRPLRYLVNTHFHFDHTDGNAWLHEAGATIIAHSQTRLRLSIQQKIPAFRSVRAASSKAALPEITFEQQIRIELGNETVLLKRHTPAHTDSDIAVYFERLDVLHAGDTWFNDIYPFVDYDGGGSIDGLITATRENLDLAGSKTLIVPGHGGVGTRDDLMDFYSMLTETRGRIGDLKGAGLPLDAVLDANPTAPFDAKYGAGFIPSDLFVSLVYRGV
jgi:glyoxylase-like metal-dependent hydrolase (beta-lactamase superfamily II)